VIEKLVLLSEDGGLKGSRGQKEFAPRAGEEGDGSLRDIRVSAINRQKED
jgi:hypothetical protein